MNDFPSAIVYEADNYSKLQISLAKLISELKPIVVKQFLNAHFQVYKIIIVMNKDYNIKCMLFCLSVWFNELHYHKKTTDGTSYKHLTSNVSK